MLGPGQRRKITTNSIKSRSRRPRAAGMSDDKPDAAPGPQQEKKLAGALDSAKQIVVSAAKEVATQRDRSATVSVRVGGIRQRSEETMKKLNSLKNKIQGLRAVLAIRHQVQAAEEEEEQGQEKEEKEETVEQVEKQSEEATSDSGRDDTCQEMEQPFPDGGESPGVPDTGEGSITDGGIVSQGQGGPPPGTREGGGEPETAVNLMVDEGFQEQLGEQKQGREGPSTAEDLDVAHSKEVEEGNKIPEGYSPQESPSLAVQCSDANPKTGAHLRSGSATPWTSVETLALVETTNAAADIVHILHEVVSKECRDMVRLATGKGTSVEGNANLAPGSSKELEHIMVNPPDEVHAAEGDQYEQAGSSTTTTAGSCTTGVSTGPGDKPKGQNMAGQGAGEAAGILMTQGKGGPTDQILKDAEASTLKPGHAHLAEAVPSSVSLGVSMELAGPGDLSGDVRAASSPPSASQEAEPNPKATAVEDAGLLGSAEATRQSDATASGTAVSSMLTTGASSSLPSCLPGQVLDSSASKEEAGALMVLGASQEGSSGEAVPGFVGDATSSGSLSQNAYRLPETGTREDLIFNPSSPSLEPGPPAPPAPGLPVAPVNPLVGEHETRSSGKVLTDVFAGGPGLCTTAVSNTGGQAVRVSGAGGLKDPLIVSAGNGGPVEVLGGTDMADKATEESEREVAATGSGGDHLQLPSASAQSQGPTGLRDVATGDEVDTQATNEVITLSVEVQSTAAPILQVVLSPTLQETHLPSAKDPQPHDRAASPPSLLSGVVEKSVLFPVDVHSSAAQQAGDAACTESSRRAEGHDKDEGSRQEAQDQIREVRTQDTSAESSAEFTSNQTQESASGAKDVGILETTSAHYLSPELQAKELKNPSVAISPPPDSSPTPSYPAGSSSSYASTPLWRTLAVSWKKSGDVLATRPPGVSVKPEQQPGGVGAEPVVMSRGPSDPQTGADEPAGSKCTEDPQVMKGELEEMGRDVEQEDGMAMAMAVAETCGEGVPGGENDKRPDEDLGQALSLMDVTEGAADGLNTEKSNAEAEVAPTVVAELSAVAHSSSQSFTGRVLSSLVGRWRKEEGMEKMSVEATGVGYEGLQKNPPGAAQLSVLMAPGEEAEKLMQGPSELNNEGIGVIPESAGCLNVGRGDLDPKGVARGSAIESRGSVVEASPLLPVPDVPQGPVELQVDKEKTDEGNLGPSGHSGATVLEQDLGVSTGRQLVTSSPSSPTPLLGEVDNAAPVSKELSIVEDEEVVVVQEVEEVNVAMSKSVGSPILMDLGPHGGGSGGGSGSVAEGTTLVLTGGQVGTVEDNQSMAAVLREGIEDSKDEGMSQGEMGVEQHEDSSTGDHVGFHLEPELQADTSLDKRFELEQIPQAMRMGHNGPPTDMGDNQSSPDVDLAEAEVGLILDFPVTGVDASRNVNDVEVSRVAAAPPYEPVAPPTNELSGTAGVERPVVNLSTSGQRFTNSSYVPELDKEEEGWGVDIEDKVQIFDDEDGLEEDEYSASAWKPSQASILGPIDADQPPLPLRPDSSGMELIESACEGVEVSAHDIARAEISRLEAANADLKRRLQLAVAAVNEDLMYLQQVTEANEKLELELKEMDTSEASTVGEESIQSGTVLGFTGDLLWGRSEHKHSMEMGRSLREVQNSFNNEVDVAEGMVPTFMDFMSTPQNWETSDFDLPLVDASEGSWEETAWEDLPHSDSQSLSFDQLLEDGVEDNLQVPEAREEGAACTGPSSNTVSIPRDASLDDHGVRPLLVNLVSEGGAETSERELVDSSCHPPLADPGPGPLRLRVLATTWVEPSTGGSTIDTGEHPVNQVHLEDGDAPATQHASTQTTSNLMPDSGTASASTGPTNFHMSTRDRSQDAVSSSRDIPGPSPVDVQDHPITWTPGTALLEQLADDTSHMQDESATRGNLYREEAEGRGDDSLLNTHPERTYDPVSVSNPEAVNGTSGAGSSVVSPEASGLVLAPGIPQEFRAFKGSFSTFLSQLQAVVGRSMDEDEPPLLTNLIQPNSSTASPNSMSSGAADDTWCSVGAEADTVVPQSPMGPRSGMDHEENVGQYKDREVEVERDVARTSYPTAGVNELDVESLASTPPPDSAPGQSSPVSSMSSNSSSSSIGDVPVRKGFPWGTSTVNTAMSSPTPAPGSSVMAGVQSGGLLPSIPTTTTTGKTPMSPNTGAPGMRGPQMSNVGLASPAVPPTAEGTSRATNGQGVLAPVHQVGPRSGQTATERQLTNAGAPETEADVSSRKSNEGLDDLTGVASLKSSAASQEAVDTLNTLQARVDQLKVVLRSKLTSPTAQESLMAQQELQRLKGLQEKINKLRMMLGLPEVELEKPFLQRIEEPKAARENESLASSRRHVPVTEGAQVEVVMTHDHRLPAEASARPSQGPVVRLPKEELSSNGRQCPEGHEKPDASRSEVVPASVLQLLKVDDLVQLCRSHRVEVRGREPVLTDLIRGLSAAEVPWSALSRGMLVELCYTLACPVDGGVDILRSRVKKALEGGAQPTANGLPKAPRLASESSPVLCPVPISGLLGGPDGRAVVQVGSEDQLVDIMREADRQLVVVMAWSPDECSSGLDEPREALWLLEQRWVLDSHRVQQEYEELADQCRVGGGMAKRIIFVAVNVKDSQTEDLMRKLGLSAFPSWQLYRQGQLLWEHQGMAYWEQTLREGLVYHGNYTTTGGDCPSDYVSELTTVAELDRLVKASGGDKGLSIVMVGLNGAAPCSRVFPTVVALAKSFVGYATFGRLIGDRSEQTFDLMVDHLGVQEVPAFLCFKEGQEVARYVGSNKEELVAALLQWLKESGVELVPPTTGTVKVTGVKRPLLRALW